MLSLAVMFCAATFAVTPAVAQVQALQIKGSIDATEDHTVTPPTMKVALEGTGHATLLGLYVLTVAEKVFLPTLASTGTFEIDTGGGATLFGTVAGQGTIISGGTEASITEVYTVAGGTGRFKGAAGAITVQRIVNRSTLNSSGTMEGNVSLPDPRP